MPGRREFLGTTLGGVAGLLATGSAGAGQEPPPETASLTLTHQVPGICVAPQSVAEALLRAEGFDEVRYVRQAGAGGVRRAVAAGEAQLGMTVVGPIVLQVDAGDSVVVLAGVHAGCFDLFATERIRTVLDLQGKSLAVPSMGSGEHLFAAVVLQDAGIDSRAGVRWVTRPAEEAATLLSDRGIDAVPLFPPASHDLRGRAIGRLLLDTGTMPPWPARFCCMLFGHREFVRRHPVATKRAMRAILKAADLCAIEPERIARALVNRGLTPRYDRALATLQAIPYDTWRKHDPEATVRFFARRLREGGLIRSSEDGITAAGTDWRFIRELRRELKG